jgi:hypothetical protein
MKTDEAINLARIVVQRWLNETPQVDNGSCAVCHYPGRYWVRLHRASPVPGKCPNKDCLSRRFEELRDALK